MYIIGSSGRKLKVPKGWKNPKNEYHVGHIFYTDLIPFKDPAQKRVKERLSKDMKDKNQELMEQIQRDIDEGSSEAEELKKRLEALRLLETTLPLDSGPVVDVVCFHDGTHWRAVCAMDTDLSHYEPLADYGKEQQYGFLDSVDMISYTVNIYEEGRVVEVYMSGSHGTHCASIAAGFDKDHPELSGIAPGAKVRAKRKFGNVKVLCLGRFCH